MKKRTHKMTTRERRERYMRSMSLTRLLIAVVALIECLLMVTFTTYSWIESSSSLVITSNGTDMSIAKNLAYQVCFSDESNAVVVLSGDPDEDSTLVTDAYYRNVLHFSFAKASSQNGKDFYFPYSYTYVDQNEVEQTEDRYRVGDTADYNTTYSYLDFELSNPGNERLLYFGPSTKFIITGKDVNSLDNDEQAILNCMRLSIQQNDAAPKIFSRTGAEVDAIASVSSGIGTTGTTTVEAISDYTTGHSEVITSEQGEESNPTKDKISVRIWFEYQAYLDYRNNTLTTPEARAAFDAKVAASKIDCVFSLAAESVFNDYIYFDDYAFSVLDERRGHYLTDETDTYGMYFHAFNNDPTVNTEENYRMSVITEGNGIPEGARRWRASVSVDHVLNLLDDNSSSFSSEHYNDAYFYYGTADGTKMAYIWKLSDIGPLSVDIETETVEGHTMITSAYLNKETKVIRCLGAANYDSIHKVYGTGIEGAVEGYAEFAPYSNNAYTDPMTLIEIKDRATGLTGSSYNSGSGSYQYITTSAGSNQFWGKTQILNEDQHYHGLYYADIPKMNGSATLSIIQFGNGIGGGGNQTADIDVTSMLASMDGKLFSPNGGGGNYYVTIDTNDNAGLASSFNLPLTTSGDPDKYRIYFYDSVEAFHGQDWTTVKLYVKYSDDSSNTWPGEKMNKVDDTCDFTQNYDDLYINQIADTANNSTQKASAKKTIRPYYYTDSDNTANNCFKAYVPSSWLTPTGNTHTYIHYNNGHFYNDATDKLRFDIGTAAANDGKYTYTMLGYSDAVAISSLSKGTGIGTWSPTREVKFDTELIDTEIYPGYVYRLTAKLDGTNFYSYPMIPVDSYGLTFRAYLPEDCNSNAKYGFLRYTDYQHSASTDTPTGYWYPQSAFSSTNTTYYAVPTLKQNDTIGNSSTSAIHGYFHVAVLNDATTDNLVYDIIHTDHPAGASLKYSTDNGATYTNISYVNNNAAVDPTYTYTVNNTTHYMPYMLTSGDTRRWIIPLDDTVTSVKYLWTPYTGTYTASNQSVDTVFEYTHNLSGGNIYFNISDGFTTPTP